MYCVSSVRRTPVTSRSRDKEIVWHVSLVSIYRKTRPFLFTANKVCAQLGIDKNKKCDDLTEEEQGKIRHLLEDEYSVEGQLRAEITLNIKRLQDIGCYRGIRHRKGLPVRGQRSRTNARTRKGPKKTVANKKK